MTGLLGLFLKDKYEPVVVEEEDGGAGFVAEDNADKLKPASSTIDNT